MPQRAATNRRSAKTRPPVDLAARLASGDSYAKIGRELEVDREVVAKWAALPEVAAEVQRIQQQASKATAFRLAGLREKALDGVDSVLDGGRCSECGRGPAGAKDVLKASEIVLDRTGFSKKVEMQVSGGMTVDVENRSDAELERSVLEVAVEILMGRQMIELAVQVRQAATMPVPEKPMPPTRPPKTEAKKPAPKKAPKKPAGKKPAGRSTKAAA